MSEAIAVKPAAPQAGKIRRVAAAWFDTGLPFGPKTMASINAKNESAEVTLVAGGINVAFIGGGEFFVPHTHIKSMLLAAE